MDKDWKYERLHSNRVSFKEAQPGKKRISKSSQLARQSFIIIAEFKLISVVSTDNWESLEIYNNELENIKKSRLLHRDQAPTLSTSYYILRSLLVQLSLRCNFLTVTFLVQSHLLFENEPSHKFVVEHTVTG